MAEPPQGRTKASALEVGTGLLTLAEISERAEQEYSERLRKSGADLEKGLTELLYLRFFSADYAAYCALEGHPARDAVLGVYRAHQQIVEGIAGPEEELRKRRTERFVAYADAMKRPHHLGPIWTVGCKFAELCGAEKDLALVMLGGTAFTATCKAVTAFLNSVEIT